MRDAILVCALGLLAVPWSAQAAEPPKAKAKRSLVDEAKALQGIWDMPPKKGAAGKITSGLRLEIRGRQITVLAYKKAGDPRGGEHLLIGRPFVLKEDGAKRLIENVAEDVGIFTYTLDGDRLTVTSESFLITKLGKEWKMPNKNLLKKVPDKK
jgi:hypothetical protein